MIRQGRKALADDTVWTVWTLRTRDPNVLRFDVTPTPESGRSQERLPSSYALKKAFHKQS